MGHVFASLVLIVRMLSFATNMARFARIHWLHLSILYLTTVVASTNSTEPFSKANRYFQPNVISSKPSEPVTIDVPPLVLPVNFNFWSKSSNDFLPNYLESHFPSESVDGEKHSGARTEAESSLPPTTAKIPTAKVNHRQSDISQPYHSSPPITTQQWHKDDVLDESLMANEPHFDSRRLRPLVTASPRKSPKYSVNQNETNEYPKKKWFVAIPLFYMQPKKNSSDVAESLNESPNDDRDFDQTTSADSTRHRQMIEMSGHLPTIDGHRDYVRFPLTNDWSTKTHVATHSDYQFESTDTSTFPFG